MVKLRCQDCGRVTDGKKADVDDSSCDECGGSFAVYESEDDEYEPQTCPICKKEITGDSDTYSCDECNEEGLCENCVHEFENAGSTLCKNCLKDVVVTETKIEYKEKIVEKPVNVYVDKEGTPLDMSFNPNNKSKFD